jgi:hypothetical protein
MLPEAVRFTAAEPREYRVFLLYVDESAVSRTACEASTGDRFTGARQSVSVTLGNASSVGTFDAPAGTVTVSCAGPEGANFVVTPTSDSLLRIILTIVTGALVAVAGVLLLIWGLVGRRVPV